MITMQEILNFVSSNWVQLVAAVITFLWIYLEVKASMWLWPVGIVLPIFWIVLSWESRFLGNIVINVYYLVASIVGWILWAKRPKEEGESKSRIGRLTLKIFSICTLVAIIVAVPVYGLMSNAFAWFAQDSFEGSSLPWADALATIVSFVGMIWLSMKLREHWYCWVVANILSAIVFFHAGDLVSGLIFVVNTGMSLWGMSHWFKLEREQASFSPNKEKLNIGR